jgi:hypothetical protein
MRSIFLKNFYSLGRTMIRLLERLVEVLERPDVVVTVDRLQRANGGENNPPG